MSDWFKFYEDGLDDARFHYAVSILPEVLPVWIWILTECCKHKSNEIDCTKKYLFEGVQIKVHVGADKVHEAVQLLHVIDYIQYVPEKRIKVLKWNEMQSDYCRKKARVDDPGPEKSNLLPLEEKRVEEIRREYPKLIAKPKTQAAIKRALKKVKFDFLLQRTKLYANATIATDKQFIPYPATWFNQERYNDDPSTWTNGKTEKKPKTQPYTDEALARGDHFKK